MRRRLIALYPADWRARYGDEFAAVLEARPVGPFDVADIVLGAIDAHLHLRGVGRRDDHRRTIVMSLRVGGYAAIAGGALWLTGLIVAGLDAGDGPGAGAVLVLGGSIGLLVALIGLSAVQARRYPLVVWAAFAVPSAGTLAAIAGIVAMVAIGDAEVIAGVHGWSLWMIGTLALVAGSGLFAAVSWSESRLPHPGLALLGLAAVGVGAILGNLLGLLPWEPIVSVAMAGLIGSFAAGWIVTGIGAVRADRRAGLAASITGP